MFCSYLYSEVIFLADCADVADNTDKTDNADGANKFAKQIVRSISGIIKFNKSIQILRKSAKLVLSSSKYQREKKKFRLNF